MVLGGLLPLNPTNLISAEIKFKDMVYDQEAARQNTESAQYVPKKIDTFIAGGFRTCASNSSRVKWNLEARSSLEKLLKTSFFFVAVS
jgi:hypothetical protein